MECVCRQNYICICNNIHMTLFQCVRRGIYIFTYKKRWMKIHKSMCTYTKLQVEKLLIYIPITLLWKCKPDSTTKLHAKLHTKTPHQSYTPDSTTKLHSRLYDKTPLHTPRQISTSDSMTKLLSSSTPKLHSRLHANTPLQTLHQDFMQKLHSRLHTKTSLFKLHGDASLPFRGIRVN
jgi:hypothetical protein